MMIIGVDGNEANVEKRVGVNEYAYQLLWNIYKLSDEWEGKYNFVIFLKQRPRNLPKERDNWQYRVIPGEKLWIIRKLTPRLLWGGEKVDVFFSPSHYLPPFLTKPAVCSIMDLGYFEFSGQFRRRDYWQLRFWSAWSIIISNRIIAISNRTKEDIVRHYRFAQNKVRVTLLGYDKAQFCCNVKPADVRRIQKSYTIGTKYVLFLGTLKPSKNIEGLLKAWKMIENDFGDYKLVVAGKKGWFYESIFTKVKELEIESRVIFTDFIQEEDKAALIKGAKVFVLPSFWEGFGMDVLSAMACKVVVVVSDRGSLPEVAGKVGVVINPEDESDIARGVKKVLLMSEREYNKRVNNGLEWVEKFSWEKTARETLKVLADAKGKQ